MPSSWPTWAKIDVAGATGIQSGWQTSHVETDQKALLVESGSVYSMIEPNEIRTIRFSDQAGDGLFDDGFESNDTSAWAVTTP